jgi:hypothetical protein
MGRGTSSGRPQESEMSWRIRTSFLALGPVVAGAVAGAQKTPDVRLDVGSPPGSVRSSAPQIAASGSSVYVAWIDGLVGADVFFNRSLDGGATWLDPAVQLSSLPVGVYDLRMAASGASVYATWEGNDRTYFNRSLDGGATWLPTEVRIDRGMTGGARIAEPQIAASGSSVYVVWDDFRNNSSRSDIYFTRSLDAGTTWLPADVRLDVGTGPGGAESESSAVACAGSSVYAVWSDGRNGMFEYDIYFNRSLDSGSSWLPLDVRVDGATGGGTGSSAYPRIAAQGASVYVVWSDDRDDVGDNRDIYFNRSLDAGTTWFPADVRLDLGSPPGAADSQKPQIAASGAVVCVTWFDARHSLSESSVYFNRSLDGGATWLPQDVRLDVGEPMFSNSSVWPRIEVAGEAVFVTWHTAYELFAGVDVYLNRSLDAGTSWLSAARRLNVGAPTGASSTLPEIAVSGSSVYVTWEDDRNGEDDIYFDLALGFQPYGLGAPGSGGIVPTIGGSGEASIGGTFSIDVANGLGGTQGRLLVGTNGPAAIPVEWGTLLVRPPLLRAPIRLDGPAGVPGAGAASVTFAVPNQLMLIGTRMNFQARFVDPGAERALGAPAAGVSFTGGLEAWIL